jgi:chlorobactene glucosyltransferase
VIALGAGVALALVLINLLLVPRLSPRLGPLARRVSALVPARDEEETIEACVRALLAEPVHEVLVLDDGSTDGTARVLRSIEDPRLRVISGRPLPPGWAGKPHACAQLAEQATGELLLFVDADVRVLPGSVAALAQAAERHSIVTAVPRQETATFAERLVVPLLHVVYYAFAPLWLIPRVRDPRVVAANGQLLLLRRDALAAFSGHAHPDVRAAIVEDQAICRAAKVAGLRVLFADGFLLATCRMYRSAREVRLGFGKSLYAGVGRSPQALAVALAVVVTLLLLPLATLPGALALLALRSLLALRFRQPAVSVLLHPLAMLALIAIALDSMVRTHRGGVVWRGRRYA